MPASLEPWRIAFYTEGLPFDGATIYETGLGGSESALYYLAREFASLGHQVQVFCHTHRPGWYEGVEYRNLQDLPRTAVATVFDLFIVSRFPRVFAYPFRSRLKVMWNHDNLVLPEDYFRATFRANLFFTLSAYHEAEYLSQLPELGPFMHRTKNGVDLELAWRTREETPKQMNKLIYASRPERGLEVLLEHIWPRLLDARPDLHLYLAGYQAPDMPNHEHIPALIQAARQVTVLGSLPKPAFYRHLAEAAMLLYPCTFPEISCIVAIEAQALGTPIITTHDFALPETVGVPDYLIPGRPSLPAYQEAFVARVLDYLDDPHRYRRDMARALKLVEQHYSWRSIARDWLDVCARYLARPQSPVDLSYSLVRVAADPAKDFFPLSLTPPPVETKCWSADDEADVLEIQKVISRGAHGDWLLVVDESQLPISLPHLGVFLDAQRLDWFGFRRNSEPPGEWAAVLCRRNRPLLPESGLEVRVS